MGIGGNIMADYTGMGEFRMWCSINLPDYQPTDGYKELLGKCVSYINGLLSETTRINQRVDYIVSAYNGIVNYNSHYPTQEEYINQVNNELDSWAILGFPEMLEAGIQKIINDRGVQ